MVGVAINGCLSEFVEIVFQLSVHVFCCVGFEVLSDLFDVRFLVERRVKRVVGAGARLVVVVGGRLLDVSVGFSVWVVVLLVVDGLVLVWLVLEGCMQWKAFWATWRNSSTNEPGVLLRLTWLVVCRNA